jgi:hypothetical protein
MKNLKKDVKQAAMGKKKSVADQLHLIKILTFLLFQLDKKLVRGQA